ncbi:hypothetical protein [Nocardia acididurans]|nr:hypothetical protein [Nocardia acididurans]
MTEMDRSDFTRESVAALLEQGLTKAEIGRLFGVSRQAVLHKSPARYIRPTYAVEATYPWRVETRFQSAPPYARTRGHAKVMAHGWKSLSAVQKSRLESWYTFLKNLNVVVEYDPEQPPLKGIASTGGWRYVPRTKADGELIIRINEHTLLTDGALRSWVFPRDSR